MLCFKSNYKTTSLPDATPCKTILSLNIIDNTALPYCLCGILVYHVVQIPCKQEANWTALCWTAARSSTVWCTCSEMQWSEPKNEGGEWFSTPPRQMCKPRQMCHPEEQEAKLLLPHPTAVGITAPLQQHSGSSHPSRFIPVWQAAATAKEIAPTFCPSVHVECRRHFKTIKYCLHGKMISEC